MQKYSVPYVSDIELISRVISHRDILTNDQKLGEISGKCSKESNPDSIAIYGSRIRKVAEMFGLVKKYPSGVWDYTEDGKKVFSCKDKNTRNKLISKLVIKNCEIIKDFVGFFEKNKEKFSAVVIKKFLDTKVKEGKLSRATSERIKNDLYNIIKWTLSQQ